MFDTQRNKYACRPLYKGAKFEGATLTLSAYSLKLPPMCLTTMARDFRTPQCQKRHIRQAVSVFRRDKRSYFPQPCDDASLATVKTLTIQLGFISAILIIVAVVLAFTISWRVSKPIADVNAEAKKLVGGTYDGSGVCGSYREINELNETLTQVAYELTKVDRMQKELIANISHDLRTPLTMIEGYTEVMRDIPGENTKENLQVIIEETKRLSTLVNDLLEISQFQTGKQQLNLSVFSITDAVRERQ